MKICTTIAGLAFFLLAQACGNSSGSDAGDRAAVEETIRQVVAAGPEDVDYFLAHVTDGFLQEYADYSREDCARPENVEDCVLEPSDDVTVTIENLEVTDDSAEAELRTVVDGEEQSAHVKLVKEDGVWKLDAVETPGEAPDSGGSEQTIDVSEIVLQLEDVPSGLVQIDADGSAQDTGEAGVQANLISFLLGAEEDAVATQIAEFEMPGDSAQPGDIVCVASVALLTHDSEDPGLALFNVAELIGTSVDEPLVRNGEVEFELLDSKLLDSLDLPAVAWRFRSPSEDLCANYKNQQAEGHIFFFINQEALGTLFVTTLDDGAVLAEATELARKQADRIQSSQD